MADSKLKQLEDRLKQIGCNFRFWGRTELRELANVLLPGEVVEHCVNGSYEGGFALLVATDQRVLLIDKKPFYLTLEDVRFDMISEVDYNHRLLNATIFICTPNNKSLRFLGYNQDRLRKLFHFVQTRVMEVRQHYTQQMQPDLPIAAQPFEPYLASVAPSEALAQSPAPQFEQQAPTASPVPTAAPPVQQMQRRVAPIVSAYTRLPIMSRQRRFLGARAINTPVVPTAGQWK